jgi:hypothetical protein
MTPDELKRIREWCQQRLGTISDPAARVELMKLANAVATAEAGGKPAESDAEIQALAERIVGRERS